MGVKSIVLSHELSHRMKGCTMSRKPSAHVQPHRHLRTVYGVCPHDCPDCCALETQVDEHGRAVSVHGRADHPVTRGWLCAKVNCYLDRVYHSDPYSCPAASALCGWGIRRTPASLMSGGPSLYEFDFR